jgi:hypothetical protein
MELLPLTGIQPAGRNYFLPLIRNVKKKQSAYSTQPHDTQKNMPNNQPNRRKSRGPTREYCGMTCKMSIQKFVKYFSPLYICAVDFFKTLYRMRFSFYWKRLAKKRLPSSKDYSRRPPLSRMGAASWRIPPNKNLTYHALIPSLSI